MFSKGSILKIALSTNAARDAFHSGADAHSKIFRKAGLAFTVIGRFATAFTLAPQGRCGDFFAKKGQIFRKQGRPGWGRSASGKGKKRHFPLAP